MALFLKLLDLISAKASVSEHSDLAGDVTPIMSAPMFLKFGYQTRSHLFDSSRHIEQVLMPACRQGWVAQDRIYNTSSMDWWVGVHGSSNTFDPGSDFHLFGLIAAHDRYAANTLSVKSEV